ncbi:ribonuclease P protein component [Mediterranea massiliensis]|uniref:ribonuclease P protein component n=1 Tax=Mediterranea massiliensis TaxID=1841865 RepID=UPI0025A446BC|nr:ribonuclease P protein component [Mediterranea massiliensis]MDM8338994.1 ribonuclease P protein component [Mediterranea massiliensis]
MKSNSLHKTERLDKKKLIEKLFGGGARSFSVFPLRVVYLALDNVQDEHAAILVSVSKRRFKRAVKRNRVKRQIREAYRLNKQPLLQTLKEHNLHIAIAFIYLSDELTDSSLITERMKTALSRISEQLSAQSSAQSES